MVSNSLLFNLTKEEANELLRWSISILRGKGVRGPPQSILCIVLLHKEELERAGYWWQAKILNFWINRYLRDLRLAKRGDRVVRRGGIHDASFT